MHRKPSSAIAVARERGVWGGGLRPPEVVQYFV